MPRPRQAPYVHRPSRPVHGLSVRDRRWPRLPRVDPAVLFLLTGVVVFGLAGWWLFLRGDESSRPAGEVRTATVSGTTITVSGVAYDVDNGPEEAIDLSVVVDGAEVAVEPTIERRSPASLDLEAEGIEGEPRRIDRFAFVVPDLDDGQRTVCVRAADDGGAVELGCTTAYVRTPIFDDAMVVAYYGAPGIPALGIAGETSPEEAARAVAERAQEWTNQNRVIIPAFDLIASIATRDPGPSGLHTNALPVAELRPYLDAIRAVGGIVILDLQSGAQDFLSQARMYEELLREPDVHLALDPEWRVPPGVAPGSRIGSVHVDEVNEVAAWLAGIVREEQLPEKIFIVHQFTGGMIQERERLADHPELAEVVHIDGFGSEGLKKNVYDSLAVDPPLVNGLKLFFDEDDVLLTSSQVRNLFVPFPLVVTYQ